MLGPEKGPRVREVALALKMTCFSFIANLLDLVVSVVRSGWKFV
jgi:hypothetical protein